MTLSSSSSSATTTTTTTTDERLLAASVLEAAEENLQSLCASHASTFVHVERRSHELRRQLTGLHASILHTMQWLSEQQEAFSDLLVVVVDDDDKGDPQHTTTTSRRSRTGGGSSHYNKLQQLTEQHRERRRTLLQHSPLLELLELPSLMDACVRSQLYSEALAIAAHAHVLKRRHGVVDKNNKNNDNNVVIQHVVTQIQQRQGDLQQDLLQQLATPIPLPICLELVTHLRRLNAIAGTEDEYQLGWDFLEARNGWLDLNPTTTNNNNHQNHHHQETVLEALERQRTRLFEIATQFQAIFPSQTGLLRMWVSKRIAVVLKQLALYQTTDTAVVRDLWEASIFFASSMGRLGADFTPQLVNLFESKMIHIVTGLWNNEGVLPLQECLHICRDARIATPLIKVVVNVDVAGMEQHDGSNATLLEQAQAPPRSLLAVPPLARFVNAILTGLNEVRRLLLTGMVSELRRSLQHVLTTVRDELHDFERAVVGFASVQGKELREAARHYQVVFATIVDPYLRGSLEAAAGHDAGAVHHHTMLRQNERAASSATVEDDLVAATSTPNEEEAGMESSVDVAEVVTDDTEEQGVAGRRAGEGED